MSPVKQSGADPVIWFDIKKSQERYEGLLDSYQNVLKDKDAYIKQLEDEIAASKRERFNLENEHFDKIREKDRNINDMKSENDCFDNKNNRLSAEILNLQDELQNLAKKNKKNLDEVLNEKSLWATEKNLLNSNIYNLEREHLKCKEDLAKAHDEVNNERNNTESIKETHEFEIDLLNQTIETIKEQTRDLETTRVDQLAKINELEKDSLTFDTVIMKNRNEAENLKRQLATHNEQLKTQLVIERKLESDLTTVMENNNLSGIDIEKLLAKIKELERSVLEKEDKIAFLEVHLGRNGDGYRKHFETVDKSKKSYVSDYPYVNMPENYIEPKLVESEVDPVLSQAKTLDKNFSKIASDLESRIKHFNDSPNMRDDDLVAEFGLKKNSSPIRVSFGDDEDKDQISIKSWAFLKSTSIDFVTSFMERDGNRIWSNHSKLLSNDCPRDTYGNYIDGIASSYNRIFSQFEMRELDHELHRLFTQSKRNYIMLYGLPLNIKLFIFHRAVHGFISRLNIDNDGQVQMVLLDEIAQNLMDLIKNEPDYGVAIVDRCRVEFIDEYSLFRKLTFRPMKNTDMTSFYKYLFSVIAGENAYKLQFMHIDLIENSRTTHTLFINRSSATKITESVDKVSDLVDQMILRPKKQDPAYIELADLMQTLDVLQYDKLFFLVVEPGKVSTYDETADFVGIHKCIERCCISLS